MRTFAKTILGIVLAMAVLLISSHGLAQEQPQADQTSGFEKELSTTVQTFDQADVILPNADLVANQVTNWTLSNRRVRLTVPVGVAYGSDVPLVMETLAECAKDHDMVAAFRPPQVLFLSFGESSLDFELRVWVLDAEERMKVKSELHQEIDRRFREAKIEIAFPQRDLHLRSLDESVILHHSEATI